MSGRFPSQLDTIFGWQAVLRISGRFPSTLVAFSNYNYNTWKVPLKNKFKCSTLVGLSLILAGSPEPVRAQSKIVTLAI